MAELPSGSIPADLEQVTLEIIHDVGLSSLTKKILRKRLEAKYQIEFTSHADAVDAVVSKLMMTPEIQRELAKIQQEKDSVSARRQGGAKRSASSDKKSKKEPKKESKKESKREVKAKKPADYPKAALSGFILFSNDNRDKVKASNPDINVTQVSTELGKLWKQASEEEKDRYQKLADEDKKRYERDMEAYLANGGVKFKRGSKGGKSEKKAKDPNAPKRAQTAYLYFANDYRTKHPEVSAKQQMTNAGAAWKSMSADDKKPYEELAAKDRQRFEAAQAAYAGGKPAAKADAASESDSSSSDSDSDSDESD